LPDVRRHNHGEPRLIRKLCFGWLSTSSAYKPDSLAPAIFQTASRLSFSTFSWFLTHPLVRRILCRVPLSVGEIDGKIWRFLIKRWWFRRAIMMEEQKNGEPGTIISVGSERVLPFVKGPIVVPSLASDGIESWIELEDRRCVQEFKTRWQGVLTVPADAILTKKGRTYESRQDVPGKSLRLIRGEKVWKRLWLAPTLEKFRREFGDEYLDDGCSTAWIDDQVRLTVDRPLTFAPIFSTSFIAPPKLAVAGGLGAELGKLLRRAGTAVKSGHDVTRVTWEKWPGRASVVTKTPYGSTRWACGREPRIVSNLRPRRCPLGGGVSLR